MDRQTFLLALSDRMRTLSEPLDVMRAALEMVGQRLGVNRVGYCDVEHDDGTLFYPTGWSDGVSEPLTGRIPMTFLGDALIAEHNAGRTVVIDDVELDERLPRGGFAAIGIRSTVGVPLSREGVWIACLFVSQTEVRAWQPDEVQILEDILERTWDAVERARAEKGRHRLERRQALLFDLILQQRQSSDERAVLIEAARALGAFLGADRSGFFELPDGEAVVFADCWTAGRLARLNRSFPVIGIGMAARARMGVGQVVTFPDATADANDTGPVFAGIGALAGIGAPIMREGRWRAGLYIDSAEPRLWAVDEIGLVREVAELTWDAVERLRVQAALAARTLERDRAWNLSRELLIIAQPDGIIEAVNPAWEAVMGLRDRELLGRPFIAFTHPDDLDAATAAFAGIFRAPLTTPHEFRFRSKDGSYRWIAWTGAFEAGRVYASGRNLTAEREQAQELRRTERRASTYFDCSDDYLFTTHVGTDGVVRFDNINATAARLIGLARADVIGRPIEAIVPETAADEIAERARTCLETRLPEAYLALREYRMGHRMSLNVRVTFVERFDDGSGVVLFSARDVTEQHRVEEALRQAQKMEAVGQLTGGLAHDFNNLLAGIYGAVELMKARVDQGRFRDLDRYLTVAEEATKRAAALTHRLLAFSRRQTLDPKPTDVNRLIGGMEELVRRTIGPQIALEVVGAAGLWTTMIDASQLENALLNLCINARDAMPDGGRITIETANKWLDLTAAAQRECPEGQYLSVCVTDTGTGMTPDVIAKAFDPFFTTKPIGVGTGLGLSMIYGFAKQSGGQVRIYSEVGQGTTVCMYLPRHYGVADVGHTAMKLAEIAYARQDETVLIVDDEPSVRMLVAEALEDLGYIAIEAADSVAGLEVLQSDIRIDLLVTDVGLPGGMNGRQMADAGRDRRPDLKVLFITGYAENAIIGNRHLQPGMKVLTKPFAMETLTSRIRNLIETP